MDVLYPLLMFGAGIAILAIMVAETRAVSARPVWAPKPDLKLVHVVDRRVQSLPFVGVDCRKGPAADGSNGVPLKTAA